jgi:hypothetical protein
MLDFTKLKNKDWEVAMLTNSKVGNIPLESKDLEIEEKDDMLILTNSNGIFPFQEGRESKEGYNEDFKKGKKRCVETFHMNKEDITAIVYYKKALIQKVTTNFQA